jgi:hypothetical protein
MVKVGVTHKMEPLRLTHSARPIREGRKSLAGDDG